MNPFIIVIYQGLSATAEILSYPTVALWFISVTASFIFTKRHSCLHLILNCGRTEDHPKSHRVLPSLSFIAQWATSPFRTEMLGRYVVTKSTYKGKSIAGTLHSVGTCSGLTKASKCGCFAVQDLSGNWNLTLQTFSESCSNLSPLQLGSGSVSSAGGKVTYFSQVSLTLMLDNGLPVYCSLLLSLSVCLFDPELHNLIHVKHA